MQGTLLSFGGGLTSFLEDIFSFAGSAIGVVIKALLSVGAILLGIYLVYLLYEKMDDNTYETIREIFGIIVVVGAIVAFVGFFIYAVICEIGWF